MIKSLHGEYYDRTLIIAAIGIVFGIMGVLGFLISLAFFDLGFMFSSLVAIFFGALLFRIALGRGRKRSGRSRKR